MNERRQIMIGMSDAGKTTFLAAMYHVVESGQVAESLQLVDLGETRDYLVQIRDEWLGCRRLDRTKLGKEQVLTFKLKDERTARVTELVLPDVSGETFRDQWEQRRSTKVFDDLAREADGVLFFIHPDTVFNSTRINQNKEVAALLDDDEEPAQGKDPKPEEPSSSEAENAAQVGWHPKFSPVQVKLTEVLYFLLREPHLYPLSRVAVIISAWDRVKSDYAAPSVWLAERLPMLNQFLRANSDRVAYKVFGVSAQGARYKKDDNNALLRMRRQAERILVVTDAEGEYSKHDITAPIRWLMDAEE